MANVPQQEAMEDILSSIRTTMAEETAKVGSGSTDLIDAAAKQDGEEDVLELSPAEMVPDSGQAVAEEGLIDLEAFASKGESKPADPATIGQAHEELTTPPLAASEPDVAVAAAESASPEEAADEFDRLLAEISQEQENQVAAVEVHKQALLDDEEPLGAPAAVPAQPQIAQVAERVAVQALSGVIPATVTYAPDAAPGTLPQVAFPAEVLAMALRPMVQEWLTQNLPGVVEQLVKAEIDKLSQS